MKMRKLVAALLAALMLCSVIPFSAAAASASATITFDSVSKRTEFDTSHQVWQENGITVTNDKGASTTNVADYANPARFYQGSAVTIEYPGMTKIVIQGVSANGKDYATPWSDSFSADASATVDGTTVTITLAAPADSFTWEKLTKQARATEITVYSNSGAPVVPPVEPDEPDVPVTPDEPVLPDGIELTIADAIAMGQTYAHNTFSENKYYVTGVITEIYNDMYGNMKVADEAGNILTIYGTWNEDGSTRFDAMAVKPVVGDTVVLYGIIGQYNGNSQMKNGWIMGIVGGDTPDVPDLPDIPDIPDEPVGSLGVVANPVAGVAYKFGMIQENVSTSDVYYLIGGMNGYYMATGKDAAAAIDVYLEDTNGDYYLYAVVNGVKQYINMVISEDGEHVNGAYESAPSTVYFYDADYQTIIADINGVYYWFGTRNDKTYTTVGPCSVEYAGFYCQFYGADEGGDAPVVPPVEPDEPDEPDIPDIPDVPSEDEIETDYPFLFGMTQYNVSEEDVYFLAGGMDGYYMATTTDLDAAIVVYVEATNGGYYFYTYAGDTKLYINMVVSGTHVNGAYEEYASTVYRYDAYYGTLIADVDGYDYWFGTRNDKEYTTVGPCKVEYEGFYCEFYYFSEEDECDHDYEWLEEMDPTCGEDGLAIYACTICGEEYVEVIPATGEHTYDDEYDADCNVCGDIRDMPDIPDIPDIPDVPSEDEIETDYPFLFGMTQYNVSEEDVYFLAGGMDGYYMATTTDPDAAIVVYVEATNGGYYFYTYDGDAKLYINMVVSDDGKHVNGAYEEYASTVYRYDAYYGTLIADVDGYDYWFGTRNDKEYTTVGPCKVEYEGFYCEFYYFSEEGECDHDYEWLEEMDPTCGEDGLVIYACTICGEEYVETIPATGEHTYDDEYDADCNVCGDIRDVPERPVETDADIVVSTVSGIAGNTVDVNLSLVNNPGIVSAKVIVYFDNTALKLVGCQEGNFDAGGYSWGDPDNAATKGFFINWCYATGKDSTADLLATLTFEILDGTAVGFYDITVEFSCSDDMFNEADETVWFNAVNGGVEVVEQTVEVAYGDLNGDSYINNFDLALMQQYLTGWDVTINEAAADGDINNMDLALMQQYLNGWDVEFG